MGWNGLIGTEYDTIDSTCVVLPPVSLVEYIFTPLHIIHFKLRTPIFLPPPHNNCTGTCHKSTANVSLETKELSKTSFEKVDCTGSTVLTIDVTSCQKIKYASNNNNKKNISQTAIQSLKGLTILQYNLSLKLSQNCYCKDFSPALPYQWLPLL